MARIDYDVGDEVEPIGTVPLRLAARLKGPFFCTAIMIGDGSGCALHGDIGQPGVTVSGAPNSPGRCGWCGLDWRKRRPGAETESELWAAKTSRDATIRVREDA
jgi:hypothetical protein